MNRQNLNTVKQLISFYTSHMKETYDNDLQFYKDNEDLIILERDVEDELYVLKYKNMSTPDRETQLYFKIKIVDFDDMKVFFDSLNKDELLYHPEDNPYTVMGKSGRIFTNEECEYLEKRIQEVFEVCTDPCKYIYETFYN